MLFFYLESTHYIHCFLHPSIPILSLPSLIRNCPPILTTTKQHHERQARNRHASDRDKLLWYDTWHCHHSSGQVSHASLHHHSYLSSTISPLIYLSVCLPGCVSVCPTFTTLVSFFTQLFNTTETSISSSKGGKQMYDATQQTNNLSHRTEGFTKEENSNCSVDSCLTKNERTWKTMLQPVIRNTPVIVWWWNAPLSPAEVRDK